ncbi:hypothetical protein A8C32_01770 [Flavivirga aquatica]|uniref:Uncharacterized protein n=1 Tax=Flavivirga aquatica TaxID=1849968 RepID=A0A1E5TA58_9FLAO|nr:hypothetical protein [Flavivirga aquatica]OEK08216.1 hypothetical protein A8C32_01770 [Flavivirga aquatica]
MRTKHFTDALTYHAEQLIKQSVAKSVVFIEDDIHSFDVYRPLLHGDSEKEDIPEKTQALIITLLDVMIGNREAYLAQFKNPDDLLMLYDMGLENPKSVLLLIFKSDYDKTSKATQNRFIIQQQLKPGIHDLN